MQPFIAHTTFYDDFESRESAYRKLVANKIARRSGGPATFWRDFSQITRTFASAVPQLPIAQISSNPRDCLAFGTARQVLMAAAMTGRHRRVSDVITQTAERFGLANQLSQPIRTLSGGETVKLALAKSYLLHPISTRLVIASPFTWLAEDNRHLLAILAARWQQEGKSIFLLALSGEDLTHPIGPADPGSGAAVHGPSFTMHMNRVRIPLTLSLSPFAGGKRFAAVDDTVLTLTSPCVLTGSNGQGKSLIARVLSGATQNKGQARIHSPVGDGRARLLFQDVFSQALLRSFSTLRYAGAAGQSGSVSQHYESIRLAYADAVSDGRQADVSTIAPVDGAAHSLMDIKTLLVAIRLAASPAAIILDEPDWGLNRQSAIAFVSAVVAVAHRHSVPVLLISHKPWWEPFAASHVRISRTGAVDGNHPDQPLFTIALAMEAAA